MSDMYCVVALDEHSREGLGDRVKQHFGNFLILADDAVLIVSNETADGVAQTLGPASSQWRCPSRSGQWRLCFGSTGPIPGSRLPRWAIGYGRDPICDTGGAERSAGRWRSRSPGTMAGLPHGMAGAPTQGDGAGRSAPDCRSNPHRHNGACHVRSAFVRSAVGLAERRAVVGPDILVFGGSPDRPCLF